MNKEIMRLVKRLSLATVMAVVSLVVAYVTSEVNSYLYRIGNHPGFIVVVTLSGVTLVVLSMLIFSRQDERIRRS